ncbi:MAG: small, acid-soluble spore protein, alpha/beta type [Eubacteriales bacterium]
MSRNYRRSRLLNPQAYDAMQQFKMECARDLGRESFTFQHNDHYKGDLTAQQNGSEGGPIGGEMVRRMIAYARTQLPPSQ